MTGAKIIAIGNQKGGVTKSTLATHLSVGLAKRGRKVLLWDLDPGSGATSYFGIPQDYVGSYEVLVGQEVPEEVMLTHRDEGVSLPENLWMISASKRIEGLEVALRKQSKFAEPREALVRPLARLSEKFDYVFLDTAPNPGSTTLAAYRAAHWFLLAATPEPGSIDGINKALEDIQEAQQYLNAQLKLLGVVVSRVKSRTRLGDRLLNLLREGFPESMVFSTEISESVIVAAAQESYQTIFDFSPGHKVTQQYSNLVTEFEERVEKELSRVGEVANG
jgi:chromosome partitioning protein